MVRRWRRDQAKLFNGELKMSAKRTTLGRFTPMYPELDQQMLEWFSDQREQDTHRFMSNRINISCTFNGFFVIEIHQKVFSRSLRTSECTWVCLSTRGNQRLWLARFKNLHNKLTMHVNRTLPITSFLDGFVFPRYCREGISAVPEGKKKNCPPTCFCCVLL